MKTILAVNAGSSSIKFSLYQAGEEFALLYRGYINNLLGEPYLKVMDAQQRVVTAYPLQASGIAYALYALSDWLKEVGKLTDIQVIGHRVVHGGKYYTEPVIITAEVMHNLRALIPLAPLHEPSALEVIEAMRALLPKAMQVACFDTAFHATQPPIARLYALPRYLIEEGIVRYGFHGISYAYIASILSGYVGEKAQGRVIVAHLGNGASMCALKEGKSIATSMGFSALEGLVMGTRSGSIDPGVVLYLLQEKHMRVEEVEALLYYKSGLLGVSGVSYDMEQLLTSPLPEAQEAVELFCYRASQEIGSLAASLGGLDAIVFTAGIGENSFPIRQKILERSAWLGVELDQEANHRNDVRISTVSSHVSVYVLSTNEELMIALMSANMAC